MSCRNSLVWSVPAAEEKDGVKLKAKAAGAGAGAEVRTGLSNPKPDRERLEEKKTATAAILKYASAMMLKPHHASATMLKPHDASAAIKPHRASAAIKPRDSLASAEISYRDVLMRGICRDNGKAVASELPEGTVEEVEEAADVAAMGIDCDQWMTMMEDAEILQAKDKATSSDLWKDVELEHPWSAVEQDEEEETATFSDLWKEVELELPWGAVEEEDEKEKEKRKDEERKEEVMDDDDYYDDEMLLDEDNAAKSQMLSIRRGWIHSFGSIYGSFEDNTSVPPMRFTEGAIPKYASCETALQIFSVQVKEIKDGLEWPLHVYGHIATRDSVDFNRNILFYRKRENCQILTQEDSYLLLTGPSRAVVLIDPVMFEINLTVRGETESEDKILSLDVFRFDMFNNFLYKIFTVVESCHTKRSTLEFTFAEIPESIEATVDCIQVIDGSWPDNLQGKVVARTASIGKMDIVLLDSRDDKIPIGYDGKMKLSRSVVSVEIQGKLEVRVAVSRVDNESVADSVFFTPLNASRSHGICDLGFCKLKITVAWSLLATLDDASYQSKKTLVHGTRRT